MTTTKKIITLCMCLFLISGSFAKAKTKTAKENTTPTAPAPKVFSGDPDSVKTEWFIYKRNVKTVFAGPFETLEDALDYWQKSNLKSKNKYFLGKNGIIHTDDPETYYEKEWTAQVTKREEILKAEEEERIAKEKAEAEAKALEEARIAKEKAEEEARLLEEARIAQEKAEEEARLLEEARIAEEKAKAEAEAAEKAAQEALALASKPIYKWYIFEDRVVLVGPFKTARQCLIAWLEKDYRKNTYFQFGCSTKDMKLGEGFVNDGSGVLFTSDPLSFFEDDIELFKVEISEYQGIDISKHLITKGYGPEQYREEQIEPEIVYPVFAPSILSKYPELTIKEPGKESFKPSEVPEIAEVNPADQESELPVLEEPLEPEGKVEIAEEVLESAPDLDTKSEVAESSEPVIEESKEELAKISEPEVEETKNIITETAEREIKEISEPVIEEKEIIEETKEELAKIQESVSDEQKNKVTKISEPEIEENPVTEEIKTDIAVNTDPVIEEPEIYTSTKNEAAKISEPEIKETKEISVKTEAKNSKDFEEEPAEEPAIETKSFFEDEAVVEDISPEYEEPVISPSKPKLVLEPEITEPEIPEARTGNRIQKTYLSDFMVYDTFELPDEEDTDFEDDISDDLNFRDSKGATSLMLSVKDGNDWKIKALIKSGADINAKDKDGWTALMYAVRYQSNLSILNLLLDAKPDIKTENNYGLSALVIASNYSDNPEIIKKLLSYYSPSDKEVQKAFIQLISTPKLSEYSLVAKMRVFLDFGLPVNAYYQGKTPLMYVCKFSSSTKAVKLLLDNNAITSIRSTEGKTAFDYAIENKNLVHDDTFWSLNKK